MNSANQTLQSIAEREAAALAELVLCAELRELAREGRVTLEDIGDRIGLSRERIRQLEVQALARLRSLIVASEADTPQARAEQIERALVRAHAAPKPAPPLSTPEPERMGRTEWLASRRLEAVNRALERARTNGNSNGNGG